MMNLKNEHKEIIECLTPYFSTPQEHPLSKETLEFLSPFFEKHRTLHSDFEADFIQIYNKLYHQREGIPKLTIKLILCGAISLTSLLFLIGVLFINFEKFKNLSLLIGSLSILFFSVALIIHLKIKKIKLNLPNPPKTYDQITLDNEEALYKTLKNFSQIAQ